MSPINPSHSSPPLARRTRSSARAVGTVVMLLTMAVASLATTQVLAQDIDEATIAKYNALIDEGKAFFLSKKFDKALIAFTAAYEIDPSDAGLLWNIARTHEEIGDYAAAITFLGFYKSASGTDDKIAKANKKIAEIELKEQGKDYESLLKTAQAALAKNDPDTAIPILVEANGVSPERHEALWLLAKAQHAKADDAAAKQTLAILLTLEIPDDVATEAAALLETIAPTKGAVTIAVTSGDAPLEGATVTLDGKAIGTTPLEPADIIAGAHTLTVTSEGFVTATKEITVEAGKPLSVALALEAVPGTLAVSAVHEGAPVTVATISVDGAAPAPLPTTPLTLAPGPHTVEVVAEGFAPTKKTVTITSGGTQTLAVALSESPGSITVTASTKDGPLTGATVLVDGQQAGTTPLEGASITPGSHEIEVTMEGFTPWTESVTVGKGQATTLAATLAVAPATIAIEVLDEGAPLKGAEVFVDGASKGTTPLEPLTVDPGSHDVVISKVGYSSLKKTLTLEAGATETLSVKLPVATAAKPPVSKPPTETPPPTVKNSASTDLVPWILAGSGALALIGGTVTLVLAMDRQSTFDDATSGVVPGEAAGDMTRQDAIDLLEERDLFTILTWTLYGAGVALGGTAATLWLLDTGGKGSVSVSVTPTAGGMLGTFTTSF